jgi:hypothetical protein
VTKKRRSPASGRSPVDAADRQHQLAVQLDLARQARAVLIDAHAHRARVTSVADAAREARVLQSAFDGLSSALRTLVSSHLGGGSWRVVTDAQDPGRWRWDSIDGRFLFDLLGIAWLGSAYADAQVDHSTWIRVRMQLDPDEDVQREVDRLARQAAGVRAAVDASEAVALRAGATDATPIPAACAPALALAAERSRVDPPTPEGRHQASPAEDAPGVGRAGEDS